MDMENHAMLMPARSPASAESLREHQAGPTAAPGQAAERCPVHRVSAEAAAFDVFEGPYHVDPAAALRWFRDKEPVFYSPKLGYWVVSRYEDVKAVFRNTDAFSPSIALEKMTPNSLGANAILARHG
jgi:cytochrome P450